jgi:hypothetical protein
MAGGTGCAILSAMPDFTPYQKKIINRYYDHRDQIMLTRLQEIVTDLYLADTETKQNRLWKRAEAALKALKMPPSQISHLLAQRKPETLAHHLRQMLEAKS